MTLKPNLFCCTQCDELYRAIRDCANDTYSESTECETNKMYMYLESTPRTSLAAELVQKLNENGFEIVKKA
jgi:hypothetical protein